MRRRGAARDRDRDTPGPGSAGRRAPGWCSGGRLGRGAGADRCRPRAGTRCRAGRGMRDRTAGERRAARGRWVVRAPGDVAQRLLPEMSGLEREELRVAVLNTKNVVTALTTVYVGNLAGSAITGGRGLSRRRPPQRRRGAGGAQPPQRRPDAQRRGPSHHHRARAGWTPARHRAAGSPGDRSRPMGLPARGGRAVRRVTRRPRARGFRADRPRRSPRHRRRQRS